MGLNEGSISLSVAPEVLCASRDAGAPALTRHFARLNGYLDSSFLVGMRTLLRLEVLSGKYPSNQNDS